MKFLAKIGLCGLLAGAGGGVLYADPPGGWLSPSGVNSGASRAIEPGSVRIDASVSLADLQVRVHLLHEQMRADSRHIQHQQQVARKEKDVIKLNCVNDKLVQVKPQMNIADSGEAELESVHDTQRFATFESISLAAENIRRLREEADQCIGEPLIGGGDSSNSFTGPPSTDDPTKGFGGHPVEPPGYASPYN
jgi:hypothetical protein